MREWTRWGQREQEKEKKRQQEKEREKKEKEKEKRSHSVSKSSKGAELVTAEPASTSPVQQTEPTKKSAKETLAYLTALHKHLFQCSRQ